MGSVADLRDPESADDVGELNSAWLAPNKTSR
jgi:hypothetical protein